MAPKTTQPSKKWKVRFALQPYEYPEIQYQIQRRGWQFLCNLHTEVGQLMIQEFYGNLWITYKDVSRVNERNHRSFVRGRIIDFIPETIRQTLRLPQNAPTLRCYSERVNRDQQLEQVLADICIPEAQWRLGTEGKPCHLKSSDLTSLARGWLDFIWRSIMPTSN
ncbi:hypothetical protein AHAS_Ahas11G0200700 [Arachis hypogaea]